MLLVLSYQLLFNHWLIVKTLLVLVSFIDTILVDVFLRFLNWFLFLMFISALLDILTGCTTLLLPFLIIAKRSMLIAFFLGWLSFWILYLVSVFLWLLIWTGSRPMLTGTWNLYLRYSFLLHWIFLLYIYIYICVLFLSWIFLCNSIHIRSWIALYGVIPVKKWKKKIYLLCLNKFF